MRTGLPWPLLEKFDIMAELLRSCRKESGINLRGQMTQPEPEDRYIALTHGNFTKVSAHRFEYLNQWRWHLTRLKAGCGYAARSEPMPDGRQKTILMHRVIMDAPKGTRVDHANRIPLDNSDENLRFATAAQNAANRKKRKDSKQPYKGVSLWRYGRWRAEIQVNGVRLFLGQFATAEEARDARETAACQLHVGFACDGNANVEAALFIDNTAIFKRSPGRKKGPRPIRPEIQQPEDPSIRYIALTKGQVAIISAHRYEEISRFYWYAMWNSKRGKYCAARCDYTDGKKTTIYLHKAIYGGPPEVIVDHENRNPLDCRDENLRAATVRQNNANNGLRRDNASGYKGVSFKSSNLKWQAQTHINGKTKHLGYFDTPEEAHAVYAKVFVETFGEFACLG